jgi:hypothetical protein
MSVRLPRRRTATTGATAIALLAFGLTPSLSSATSTKSTSPSERLAARSASSESVAGTSFATRLLATAPRPKGAELTAAPPSPLDISGVPALMGLIEVHHYYVLKAPIDLASFLISHRARGSVVSPPATMSGTDIVSTTSYAVTLPFASRHISFEEIVYTTGRAFNGVRELRVDALVQWSPIRTVWMPTSGVATVTIYQRLSGAFGSSDPISVVLTHAQVLKFRSAIATLSNTLGGTCSENLTLFTVKVSPGPGEKATWIAVAGECPNDLIVTSGRSQVLLSDGSCTVGWLAASLVPSLKANATVKHLNSCVPA